MKTGLTRLLHVALSFCLAFVLLLTVLPMKGLAADEAGQAVTTDISALTLENIPDVLKNALNIAIDYSSALGINTYSLREAPVLKTGLAIGDAQRLDGLTLVNPDGTKTAYSFGADIKFIEDNAVKFIDNQIINKVSVENGKLFFYQTKQSDSKLYLPLNISSGLLFKNGDLNMTLAPASLSLSLAQLKQINENEYAVQYDNVFAKGISLQYLSVYGGFKENIIINEKNGISEFSYNLNIPGYKAELTDGGKTVTVYNKENSEKSYVFGKPFAQDANGKLTDECNYKLTHVFGDRYILTLCADKDFLNDADTAYPVTVDPPLEVSRGSVEDASISNAPYDNTSANLYVGLDPTLGNCSIYSRCNFLWYFRHLRPEDITDAYFNTAASYISIPMNLNLYDSNLGLNYNSNIISEHIDGAQGDYISSVHLNADNYDCNFDITVLMQKWLKHYLQEDGGKDPGCGFIIKSTNTTSDNIAILYSADSSHQLYPYFTITYEEQNTITEGYYYIKNQQYESHLLYEEEIFGADVCSGEIQHGMYARWYIKLDQTTSYGEKFYTITPNNSDELYMCSNAVDPYANNSNIAIGYINQKWRIIQNADGSYRIMPSNTTMQCITTNTINLDDNDTTNDIANTYTYEYYGWPSMKWELESLTTGVGAAFEWNNGLEYSDDVNCLGYALGVDAWPDVDMWYGDSVFTIYDRTKAYVENNTNKTIYMLESSDAPIRENEYRVAMRVGNYEDLNSTRTGYYYYYNGNSLIENSIVLKKGNTYYDKFKQQEITIDRFLCYDYHYMRQTDTGVWAEKHGATQVNPTTDVREGNPSMLLWNGPDDFSAYTIIENESHMLYAYLWVDGPMLSIVENINASLIIPDTNNIIDHMNFYNSDTVYFAVSIGVGG